LVDDHLLLRDFGPYGIIFMKVYVVITVTTVMLLRYSGPCVTSVYMLVGDHLPLRDFGPHGILDLRFSKLE
jgi:hypothetical protein